MSSRSCFSPLDIILKKPLLSAASLCFALELFAAGLLCSLELSAAFFNNSVISGFSDKEWGEAPFLVLILILAPWFNNLFKISLLSFKTAKCKGVVLSLPGLFTKLPKNFLVAWHSSKYII